MIAYADSSVLVSLYSPDTNSIRAATALSTPQFPITIGSPVELEVINAINLRIFRGEASAEEAEKAIGAFKRDILSGFLILAPLPRAAWELAGRLSQNHSATLGTRSLDILQVSIALALKAQSFLTFDRRQARLARLEGLETLPD